MEIIDGVILKNPFYIYMWSLEKRKFVSFFICLPARFFLAVSANKLPPLLFLFISGSFLYQYFTNSRKIGISGAYAWWADYRLIHGLLFLSASIYRQQEKDARIPLFLDTFFGFILFSNYFHLFYH